MIPYKLNPLGSDNDSYPDALTFIAVENNSSVRLVEIGSPSVSGIKYKVGNGGWKDYQIGERITLKKIR